LLIGRAREHADGAVRSDLNTVDRETFLARGTNGAASAAFFELDFVAHESPECSKKKLPSTKL
jgi:hypothetical protein